MRTPARIPPITADRLIRGWAGPAGTRIRLARAGDRGRVADLLRLLDMPLHPAIAHLVDSGSVASTLLTGLRQGANEMLRPLTLAATSGAPDDALVNLALLLVAEGREGRLDGVVQIVAPRAVLLDAVQGGVPLARALLGAAKIAKVQALAVGDHARGLGLGRTLLRRAVRVYTQLGYRLLYGQFPAGSGLESFYAGQGFTVLADGADLDLSGIGLPVLIRHEPDERMFARWRTMPADTPY